jgi:hypothetical protein
MKPRAKVYRLESDLTKDAMAKIRDLPEPSHCFKVHGGKFQDAGQPDIIGCLRGRMLAIEMKLPGERPTGIQMGTLRRWESAGALAGWATSLADVEDLLGHVDEVDWKNPALARDRDAVIVDV